MPQRASRGLWRDAARRLLRNGPALIGLVCIVVFVVGAILAPVLSPYDPSVGQLADARQTPTLTHLMGTDLLGRDEFTRVLYGARLSLQLGVIAVLCGPLARRADRRDRGWRRPARSTPS